MIVGTREAFVSSLKGKIKFNKVLYVSSVKKNFLSIGKIVDQDQGVYFNSSYFFIIKPPNITKLSHIVASGTRDHNNGLYKLSSKISKVFAIISNVSPQV